MKKNLPVLILSITLLFLGSCKSASKLYEKGDYAEAVELATKKLRKNPNDAELRSVLRNAYDYAVNDHERKIREYNNSTNELKWEWIYYEYSGLQRLSQAIWSSSEATELVNPPDYTSFLETYADNASSVRYDKGIRWMEQQDRESMKQAYREFKAALGFKPGDMDIQLKMREAYDMAVINVIVMPFNESSYRYSSYTNTYDQFYKNNLVSNLRSYGPVCKILYGMGSPQQ